ncbi:MAG TPA: type II toxin-antitoxin system VapC family toxin [Roseiarcus sp.]
MTDKVVDASAIVALLFNELTRDEIVPRLRGFSLRAPDLIRFEVASACLKKIRAAPRERQALFDAFSLLDDLSISSDAVDLEGAIDLAQLTKLSLYDASYLWLARALGVELVTLDDKLARADEALRGWP